MLAKDTLLDNRYRIAELLGTGAMGSVYLALDERLSCNVAVKGTIYRRFNLSPQEEANLRRAFEREAKLLANLQHEAIPRVIDFFEFEDEQYLVMEYIAGEDLFEQAEKQRRKETNFPVTQVFDWAFQLLDALEYLHTQPEEPVIHKDIKLSNLKIANSGRIRLLDFGIAKGFAGEMTRVEVGSLQMGTEEYSPIEQFLKFPSSAAVTLRHALSINHADKVEMILQQQTDGRSDLYSLAVTVYRLLTHKSPTDYLPRALALWEGKPDPLVPAYELNPEVPVPVSEVLTKALALNKEDRPSSAAEMRSMLQQAWREHWEATQESKKEISDKEHELEKAEWERRLTEEIRRREQVEAALTAQKHEIAETKARLQEITNHLHVPETGNFQTANNSIENFSAEQNSFETRRTNENGNSEDSLLSKILGRKHLVLIAVAIALVSGLAFSWQMQRSATQSAFSEHFEKGSFSLKNKEFDTAIGELTRAIEINPNSAESYANRGEAFRKKEDYDRALADFDAALKLNPRDLFARTNRAGILCQKQDYDRSAADFDEVWRQNPNYDFLYEKRGACYENRDMLREALADYNKALSIDPEESWTYFRRGFVHFLLNEDEEAIADYTEKLRRTPEDFATYSNRGAAYQRLGKRRLAAEDFKKTQELKAASDKNS